MTTTSHPTKNPFSNLSVEREAEEEVELERIKAEEQYIISQPLSSLGIGDWGLGIGDWAQSPIPNPQSPIPSLNFKFYHLLLLKLFVIIYFKLFLYYALI
jgi:hypothetical protein